jgi:hypothetical protein
MIFCKWFSQVATDTSFPATLKDLHCLVLMHACKVRLVEQVGLMLLAQCSSLTTAVMTLQQHPRAEVAQKAGELVSGWAERAEVAEALTRNAMQQDGKNSNN